MTTPIAPGPDLEGHSLGRSCMACWTEEGGRAPKAPTCVHQVYGRRWLRFLRRHRDELSYGAIAGEGRAAAAVLQRLHREYATLPPRHDCSCVCPLVQAGRASCPECRRLQAYMREWQIPEEPSSIHGGRAHSPVPTPVLLDLVAGLAYRR